MIAEDDSGEALQTVSHRMFRLMVAQERDEDLQGLLRRSGGRCFSRLEVNRV